MMVNYASRANFCLWMMFCFISPVMAEQTLLASSLLLTTHNVLAASKTIKPDDTDLQKLPWDYTRQNKLEKQSKPSKLLVSGLQAFNNQDYRLARYILKELAETKQSVDAYHLLGVMAAKGLDEAVDYQKAVGYWVQAVKQNFPPSLYQLGKAYRYGYGLEVIPENARELFERAANQHPGAAYELGVMFEDGVVGDIDLQAALTYIQAAADKNFPQALFWLGEAYELGILHPSDSQKSANVIAATFYEKAARVGSVEAQKRLGDFYAKGRDGVPKDPGRAYMLIRLASDMGDAQAQAELGLLHLFGVGTVKTPVMAIALFRAASLQGYAKGHFLYGNSLRQQHKIQDALIEYKAAAKQDFPEALFNLAVMSFKGISNIAKNSHQVRELALRAYQNGSVEAAHLLGVIAIQHDHDPVTALAWFRKAQYKGHAAAAKAVVEIQKELSKQQIATARSLEVAAMLPPVIPQARQQSPFFSSDKHRVQRSKHLLRKLSPATIGIFSKTGGSKESSPKPSRLQTKVIQPRLTRTPFLGQKSQERGVSLQPTLPLPELSVLKQTPEVQKLIGETLKQEDISLLPDDREPEEEIPDKKSKLTRSPTLIRSETDNQ